MPTILIIEDSATERRMLTDILAGTGWTIVTAESAEEGQKRIDVERPDLLLLDVVLPDENGFQLCRRLKQTDATRNLPIALVTSKDGEADRFWGKKQGADAYLTKPVDADELLSTVRKLLP